MLLNLSNTFQQLINNEPAASFACNILGAPAQQDAQVGVREREGESALPPTSVTPICSPQEFLQALLERVEHQLRDTGDASLVSDLFQARPETEGPSSRLAPPTHPNLGREHCAAS